MWQCPFCYHGCLATLKSRTDLCIFFFLKMNVLQGRGEKVAGSQIASETRLQCVGCTTWNEISWEWKGKRSLQNAKGQMLGKQRGEEARVYRYM